ncbi:MAG: nucleotidyltransferase family protein [Candidatus Moranbacteria bacterium]|nr:nucleotidyltransferase family protein [Candidatus Moranbacteria bacterium]
MQIVILTAGLGTRMKELTKNVPKNMLPVKGKPILAYKLEALPDEIDEVIFVIGYLGNQIRQYFGDFYGGRKISYVVQKKLDGTGGAVHLIKDLIGNDFLVMNVDDLYLKKDVENVSRNELALLGLEITESNKFGVIEIDQAGYLKKIIEKGEVIGTALANVGLYKLNRNFFNYPLVDIGNGEFGLPQTLAVMAKDFPVKVEKASDWFPIGDPQQLEKAQEIIDKFTA